MNVFINGRYCTTVDQINEALAMSAFDRIKHLVPVPTPEPVAKKVRIVPQPRFVSELEKKFRSEPDPIREAIEGELRR
jgi:hypothetical protein